MLWQYPEENVPAECGFSWVYGEYGELAAAAAAWEAGIPAAMTAAAAAVAAAAAEDVAADGDEDEADEGDATVPGRLNDAAFADECKAAPPTLATGGKVYEE